MPLNDQELLNAIYSGPFVTAAKAEFSNSQNANIAKWSAYIQGSEKRQEILERALDWVSDGAIDGYMSKHRRDPGIAELKLHFTAVIDWASSVFENVEKEMCGLEWGRLYREHKDKPYDPAAVSAKVQELYADPYVKSRKGIFEFILRGCCDEDLNLLDVRIFDEATKKRVYARQTAQAHHAGASNCPLCASGGNANQTRIWALKDMEADHVSAWSNGGTTSEANCEMLCKTHNRSKGNR